MRISTWPVCPDREMTGIDRAGASICSVETGGWGAEEPPAGAASSPAWVRRAAMGSAAGLPVVAAVVLLPDHHTPRTSTAAANSTSTTRDHGTTHPARTTTTAGPSRTTNPITFTAVGDTGLGKPGELPADALAYLSPIQGERPPRSSSATSRAP